MYGSMLWTLLNLWTLNFGASSIIYPTSLYMELLHSQSYKSMKTIFVFLCNLLILEYIIVSLLVGIKEIKC
ncbi:hypothetical protein DVH24_004634 [Malus domestica]|uniref:Uncharacterized protein n=1 Tax=Malus domestica TaxID=3750 RepID=A0A498IBX8_MALDO|nr:hypothetical protein DVH24_004634 [Malus domestica]